MTVTVVTDEAGLNDAILAYDTAAQAGVTTIDISGIITEGTDDLGQPLDLYAINNATPGDSLLIEGTGGSGGTIDGAGLYRGLLVYAGNVTIENLTIADAKAIGGVGGAGGGGGGAGLGGGLFVAGANVVRGNTITTGGTVTLNQVTFTGDSATGGAGGHGASTFDGDGGGGGGLGGAGGAGANIGSGGGGVGVGAAGASNGQTGSPGVVIGAYGGGAGYGSGDNAGGTSGGGGGSTTALVGSGGGGGVRGDFGGTGAGGYGGFGGGGGGGQTLGGGGSFGGGGGGSGGGQPGSGGFGGGGGGGLGASVNGGFGGGGGAFSGGGGGGGLGAGGDIFVQQGAVLLIEGGTVTAGAVHQGLGGGIGGEGGAGTNGDAFANGLFIQGNEEVTLAPLAGQTLTIDGVISDPSGSVSGGLGVGGLFVEGPGTVVLDALNSFTGGISIDSGGTLVLAATGAAGTGAIFFEDGAGLLVAGSIEVANTIDGFTTGDSIDFQGIGPAASTTATIANHVLTVTDGTHTQTLDLDPNQSFGTNWAVTSDGAGGVMVACYCHGTHIGTPAGEVAIETLRIGDLVWIDGGGERPIKWIGRRSYPAGYAVQHPRVQPIRIRAGALSPGLPTRDLLVSPEHSLMIDGVLVAARHLVNGVSVVADEGRGAVHYLHLEFARHEIILAEGQPAGTFVDCDSRTTFANVAEFAVLYPNDPSPKWKFCADRIDDGEALADIRDRVNARAGLGDRGWREDHVPGRLKGNLEVATGEAIVGWAQDASAPERPVWLEILANGQPLARVLANAYRRDLEQAGLGSGRHAFRVRPAARHTDDVVETIEVRRVTDRAALPGSPAMTECRPASRQLISV